VPHLLTHAGLRRYRPHGPHDPASWDELYESGELDYYDDADALARYGILAAYAKQVRARSIVDLGCGPGLFRPHLEGVGFTSYLGIDPSQAAIERARRLQDERTSFAVAEHADPGDRFDVAVCNDVLFYVADAGEFLDRVRDVLEPGGHVLSAIWRHPGDTLLHRRLDERFELVDRVLLKQLSDHRRSRWLVSCHRRR
jgi:SAM-dependent methyltransferase